MVARGFVTSARNLVIYGTGPGLLLFLDFQGFEAFEHVGASRRGTDLLIDVEDSAIGPDVKRPAVCERSLLVDYTVRTRDVLLGIRQYDVVRVDARSELLVGFGIVDACSERDDILKRPDTVAALTERLAFSRSSPGESFGEPGKHHGLAFVVRQLVDLAVGALERKLRRLVTNLQFGLRNWGLRWSGWRRLGERRER